MQLTYLAQLEFVRVNCNFTPIHSSKTIFIAYKVTHKQFIVNSHNLCLFIYVN